MRRENIHKRWAALAGILGLAALGCGDGSGTLVVMLGAETTIADGLEPGDSLEEVRDGWRVRFDTWIGSVGDFWAVHRGGHDKLDDHDVHVIDLKQLPQAGLELTRFEDARGGRWDWVEYKTPAAYAQAHRHSSVSQADFDEMVLAGASFLLAGSIEKDEQTIQFRFAVPASGEYYNCEDESGNPGFAITDGGTTSIALTLHGDHIFFNSFPIDEGMVVRRAGWLARADLNDDGEVTREELESIRGTQLAMVFPASEYDLSGGGRYLGDDDEAGIESAWDFVVAQMMTVGHYQGEGHCAFTSDGAHDHSHAH